MKLSVALPTSDMIDKDYFFTRCLESLWHQTFQDFEIVVTDNSEDEVIENICNEYKTGIKYYRNPVKGMAQNTNEAISRSSGELIKILYMDDYLAHERSLEKIIKCFSGHWLATGCTHTINGLDFFNDHVPYYSDNIRTGNNTIGSPSVVTILNKDPLMFDESMTWLLDCDYYYRMHQLYGDPVLMRDINVCMGLHEDQATNTMGDERKLKEHQYISHKYE